jgi:hypothetical protein
MLLNASVHWLSDKWVFDLTTDVLRMGTLCLEGGVMSGDHPARSTTTYVLSRILVNITNTSQTFPNILEHLQTFRNTFKHSQTPRKHSRTFTITFKHLQTLTNIFKHLQTSSNTFGHLQRLANYDLIRLHLYTTTLAMRRSFTALSK